MQTNPYSPPQAHTEDVSNVRASRPISVWLLFLAFTAMTLLSVAGLFRFVFLVASNSGEIKEFLTLALAIVWRFVAVALLIILTVSVFNRKQWARWIGFLVILLFLVLCLILPDTTVYSNEAEKSGGVFARYLMIPLLIAWWAYAYGFSAKSKRYFSTSPDKQGNTLGR